MHEVIMPKLGLTMETGTIEKWHKKEGDQIETGEVLFEVMTDKVSLEVESYNSGTLLQILKKEGDEVPVTEVIAYIGKPDEKIPGGGPQKESAAEAEAAAPDVPSKKAEKEKPVEAAAATKAALKGIKISPLARRIAEAKSVDITKIKGTGPGGRIVKEDIENFVEEARPAAAAVTPVAKPSAEAIPMVAAKAKSSTPLKGIRKIIAERLTWSKQNIPHIISTVVIDVASMVEMREKIKERVLNVYGVKVTITDFIIKAVAQVLEEQPVINSSLVDQDHVIYEDVNVGLAVATDAGLIVPTIYGAHKLNLFDIALKRAELVEKTKKSRLQMEEISNGTFTISNLGMFGVRNFTAIINPPQGAILMVGEVYKEPAVINDKIDIGTFMQVSLAVDHRIIDGADGARYLQRLKELLESPELLLI